MEISRDKLSAKLDSIPESDREGYVQALKAKGYTWKTSDSSAPDKAANYTEALLTNKPTVGIKQELVRSAPAMALSIPASAIGTAAGGPMLGIAAAGMAGIGAEATRQGAVGLYAIGKDDPKNYPIPSPSEMTRSSLVQGGLQAGGEAGGLLLGPALRGAGRFVVNNPIARTVGQYTKEQAGRLLERPAEVIAQMGEGKIGQAAGAFKSAVGKMVDDAGTAYENLINQVTNGSKYGPNFKIDLKGAIGKDVEKIAQDYGYEQPGRIGPEAASGQRFKQFAQRLDELSNASPEEVYWFQRDLGNAARSSADPVLKSALGKMKEKVMGHFGTQVSEVGEANAGYRAVMELNDELASVTNADDAARIIKNKMAGNGETRAAIEQAAAKYPAIKSALDSVMDANAAVPFSRELPGVPATGFLPGAALTAKFVTPAAIPAGILGAAGVSPLATAYATKAAQAVSRSVPAGTYRVISAPAAGAAASHLSDYYGRTATP